MTWHQKKKKEIQKGASSKNCTHQLWDDGGFYAGLDLPQVVGLVSELILNGSVCLETTMWLVSK